MSKLFGRPVPSPEHADALAELWKKDEKGRALAENLMHDARVSDRSMRLFHLMVKREQSRLSKSRGTPIGLDAEVLFEAAERYKKSLVVGRRKPPFVGPWNRDNILNNGAGVCQLQVGEELLNLLNLPGLAQPLHLKLKATDAWRKAKASPKSDALRKALESAGSPDRPGKPDPKIFAMWIQHVLDSTDDSDREIFVRLLLDALNEGQKDNPHQPTWATKWSDFENAGYLEQGPNRWSEVLGLNHNQMENQWLVLLVYPVTPEMVIVRPTQLEAGNSPLHYPTPSQAELAAHAYPNGTGGHPMDLNPGPSLGALLPEYIHQQVAYSLGHRLVEIAKTTGKIGSNLRSNRARHRQYLLARYWPEIMP